MAAISYAVPAVISTVPGGPPPCQMWPPPERSSGHVGSQAGGGGSGWLRWPYVRGHARHVRHATEEDLDHIEALLVELRKLPQLRERKRGYFSRGSRAFLHFHEDAGDFYVDVRLDAGFQRVKVTSRDDRAEFLSQVRTALQTAPFDGAVDRSL